MTECRSEDVKLTVICITYNHRNYIEQCLNSLISQLTSFRYKIVVHDDASTDGTSDVLRRYASKYPDIIEVIIQNENLYSKGISASEYIAPHIEGRYCAICEGDDYWIEPTKLQKQFDYMESNPGCVMTAHAVKIFDDKTQKYRGKLSPSSIEKDFTLNEIISPGYNILSTGSRVYKSEYYILPNEFLHWGIGDYPSAIYFAMKGAVHFFPDSMSAYRTHTPNSWSERMSDRKLLDKQDRKIIKGLKRVDECTHFEHSDCIEHAIFQIVRRIEVRRGKWRSLHSGKMGAFYKHISIKEKFIDYLKCIRYSKTY